MLSVRVVGQDQISGVTRRASRSPWLEVTGARKQRYIWGLLYFVTLLLPGFVFATDQGIAMHSMYAYQQRAGKNTPPGRTRPSCDSIPI